MKICNILSIILLSILAGTSCQTYLPDIRPSPTPEILETPVVSKEKGGFQATFIYKQNGQPVRHQEFYLAEMIPVEGQLKGAYVPALDRVIASGDESSDNGQVVISMVPPGKYALAIMTPLGPILVVRSDTNKEIIFDIVADQITDIGRQEVILDPDELEPPTK